MQRTAKDLRWRAMRTLTTVWACGSGPGEAWIHSEVSRTQKATQAILLQGFKVGFVPFALASPWNLSPVSSCGRHLNVDLPGMTTVTRGTSAPQPWSPVWYPLSHLLFFFFLVKCLLSKVFWESLLNIKSIGHHETIRKNTQRGNSTGNSSMGGTFKSGGRELIPHTPLRICWLPNN